MIPIAFLRSLTGACTLESWISGLLSRSLIAFLSLTSVSPSTVFPLESLSGFAFGAVEADVVGYSVRGAAFGISAFSC